MKKVSQQFDELMKERETHDGNDENFVTLVKEKLIYLRDNLKKPEEIVSEAETDAMLDYLTETGLEEFAARKAAEEHRQKGIIENQRKEITEKTKEIANKDSILRKTLEQLRKQEQAKKDEIYSKQKMKYKEDCQLCVGRQITKLWVKYVGIVMFYFASLAFLTYFAWSKETKSIIVTFIVILLPYILKFITLDTLKQTFYFLTSFGYRKIQRKRIVREYILRKSPPTRCTVKNKDIMNIIK